MSEVNGSVENDQINVLNQQIKNLQSQNERLIQELATYKNRQNTLLFVAQNITNFIKTIGLRFLAGEQLYENTCRFWDSLSEWVGSGQKGQIEPATRNLVAAVLARFMKISTIGLFIAVIPTIFLVIQTVLIYQQNIYIKTQNDLLDSQNKQVTKQSSLLDKQNVLLTDQNKQIISQTDLLKEQTSQANKQNELFKEQNEKIDIQTSQVNQQNALQAFEQSSNFRTLLRLEPTNRKSKSINDSRDSQEKELFWPAPNLSVVSQITLLGERQPELIVPSLKPLLEDSEPTVVCGALIAIQKLINHDNQEIKKRARQALHPNQNWDDIGFGLKVRLKNIDLENVNFIGFDLSKSDLENTDFTGCNLQKVNLRQANMRNANLSKADLMDANLSKADLTDANLKETRLVSAKITHTRLSHINLEKANLTRIDLRNSELIRINLTNAKLEEANLTGTKFFIVNLVSANLSQANLTNAEFVTNVELENVIMRETNLSNISVFQSDFIRANLSCAIFRNAKFDDVMFKCSDLRGTDFRGARINQNKGMSPSEISDLKKALIGAECLLDEGTKLGFLPKTVELAKEPLNRCDKYDNDNDDD